MRSRYSAYVTNNLDYLNHSWHPKTRPAQLTLDPKQRWLGLKVKTTQDGRPEDDTGVVEFVALFGDVCVHKKTSVVRGLSGTGTASSGLQNF